LSFGYIAVRHGRRQWLVIGAIYLALMIAGVSLLVTAPNTGPWPVTATAGLVIVFVIWPTGFIHALWVNFTVRLPLVTKGGRTIPPKTLTGS
jgi:hypothetical protein